MTAQPAVDRTSIHQNMERASRDLPPTLDQSADLDFSRRSNGTRRTNEQPLFHMLFGYLIVRALLPIVRVFGRFPDGAGRLFAALLNSATRPFHIVNYLGCVEMALVKGGGVDAGVLAQVIGNAHQRSSHVHHDSATS